MVKDDKETKRMLLSLVRFIIIIFVVFYVFFKFNISLPEMFFLFIALILITDFRLEKKLIQKWRDKHGNRNQNKG